MSPWEEAFHSLATLVHGIERDDERFAVLDELL